MSKPPNKTNLADPDMDNIQCFEAVAAGLLAHLYTTFPQPTYLESEKFESQLIENNKLPPHCRWPEHKAFPGRTLTGSTIAWLAEEKLVRCQSHSSHYANTVGLVLTARGFAALNAPVLPEEDKETHGRRLTDAAKKVTNIATTATIQSFIRSLF